jgi:hypothetical protein
VQPLYDITGVKSYGEFDGPWTTLCIKKTTVTGNSNSTVDIVEGDEDLSIAQNWKAGLQLVLEGKDHYGSGYIADGSSKHSIFVGSRASFHAEIPLIKYILFFFSGKAWRYRSCHLPTQISWPF